jgi:hypothetical protein
MVSGGYEKKCDLLAFAAASIRSLATAIQFSMNTVVRHDTIEFLNVLAIFSTFLHSDGLMGPDGIYKSIST